MNNSICYLKITKPENEAIEDKALRIFIKMQRTLEKGILVFGDCTDDIDKFYMIWDYENNIETARKLKKTGIKMEFKELTKDILNGEYDENFKQIFSSNSNQIHLMQFLKNNLTIDALLDKIIEKGENSLTDFEKSYLIFNSDKK